MDLQENPYDASQFAGHSGAGSPSVGTARTMGTLNIVFAILLGICGMVYGFYMMVFTMMPTMFEGMEAAMQEERDQQIQELQDREDAAETDEEKEQIAEAREQLEKRETLDAKALSGMFGGQSTAVKGYFLGDLVTGLLLNIAMFASGIGLVALKKWGRTLAQWVNMIKLARLVLLYGILLPLVIVPLLRQNMIETLQGMKNAGNVVEGSTAMGYSLIVTSITVLVLGLIYPLLSLILLSRPGVKLACGGSEPERFTV